MKMKQWMGAAVLSLGLAVGVAQAHAHLHESSPANGAVLKSAPKELSMSFSEAVQFTALTLSKDGAAAQKLEPLPRQAAAKVSVPLPALGAGSYTVSYRVVSDDGHLMNGTLAFTLQ
ncbi:MAG: copper resistance protein CopC [Steroidobacteraceae bacterium]